MKASVGAHDVQSNQERAIRLSLGNGLVLDTTATDRKNCATALKSSRPSCRSKNAHWSADRVRTLKTFEAEGTGIFQRYCSAISAASFLSNCASVRKT